MRRLTSLLVLAVLPAAAAGADLRFESPGFDSPQFAIRLTLSVRSPVAIKEILVNGVRTGRAIVFLGGKNVDASKPMSKGAYEVVVDYAWAAKKKYTVSVVQYAKSPEKTRTSDFSGVSPASGGVPEGSEEGFYRTLRVHEEAGIERTAEICYSTLTASKDDLEEPRFRLFVGPVEIPFQVLDRRESLPPDGSGPGFPVTVTYKIAFPVDAAANANLVLIAVKGQPSKPSESALTVAGEGLGRTVQNKRLTLQFQPKSGQILTIDYPKEKVRLWNKEGVIHWNPDIFVPGVWDHSFQWNPPQEFEEKAGALVYLNSRRGPMASVKDARLEVRYLLEADSPYFIAETMMTVEKDMGVIALRNDEMVFFRELFDTLMYRDKDGQLITLPLKERTEAPYGLAHIAPPDVPWAGLLNMKEGYGFFTLRLEAADPSLGAADDFLHKAGTYFYAPSDGTYVYWVRPLLYTWDDFTTNNLMTFVPKGSVFYEKNAYVLLRLSGQTPRELDTLLRRLKNPLRVF